MNNMLFNNNKFLNVIEMEKRPLRWQQKIKTKNFHLILIHKKQQNNLNLINNNFFLIIFQKNKQKCQKMKRIFPIKSRISEIM